MTIDFIPFSKIARLRREIVVTEKIDGTNACILVPEDGGSLLAGKRSGWIAPGPSDNFWFAQWVLDHQDELRSGLGTGTHFGEWWGERVNRRYPIQGRKFSLFNTERWMPPDPADEHGPYGPKAVPAPNCCSVVPVLHRAPKLVDRELEGVLEQLRSGGSVAAPGCKAEGIVVFHTASRHAYKITLEKDDEWKGKSE